MSYAVITALYDRRTNCPRCDGAGWVCENHPTLPWNGSAACGCGGDGKPCPTCTPSGEVDPPHLFINHLDDQLVGNPHEAAAFPGHTHRDCP